MHTKRATKKAPAKSTGKRAAPKKEAAKKAAPKRGAAKKRPPARPKPAAPPLPPDRLVAHLAVHDGAQAMEFYKAAFGAEELERMTTPDGRLMHGEIRLAGHRVFLSDEFEPSEGGSVRAPRSLGGTCVRLMLEVPDADAAAARAVAAGAEVLMPVQEVFWGARYGKLRDPFGHEWAFNQQQSRLTSGENQAATSAFLAERNVAD